MLVNASNNFANDFKNAKRHLSTLDQSISSVLNQQDLPDAEKLRLYQQTLYKYLQNREQVESELDTPVKVSIDQITPVKSAEESFLNSLQDEEKQKAVQVLSDVKTQSPLSFDVKGQLVHDGLTVEGSNLSDLVSHELKQKKGKSKPIGWEIFSNFRQSISKKPQSSVPSASKPTVQRPTVQRPSRVEVKRVGQRKKRKPSALTSTTWVTY